MSNVESLLLRISEYAKKIIMTSLNVFNESFNPILCRNQSRIDLHEFLEPTVAEAEQLPRSLVRLALWKICDATAVGYVFVHDRLGLPNII